MTNEQLYMYLSSIVVRLQDLVVDVNNLEDANERDIVLEWTGQGLGPVEKLVEHRLTGSPLPDGYVRKETGRNAAAQLVDGFIDDLRGEMSFLLRRS
jgi:hypothetical protein